jgi:hypothetical protein
VIPAASAAAIPLSVVAARDMITGIPAWADFRTMPAGCRPVQPMTQRERSIPFNQNIEEQKQARQNLSFFLSHS